LEFLAAELAFLAFNNGTFFLVQIEKNAKNNLLAMIGPCNLINLGARTLIDVSGNVQQFLSVSS
jgi:hypothetical protein